MKWLYSVLAVVGLSCGSSQTNIQDKQREELPVLNSVVIFQDEHSNVESRETLLISDQETLDSYFTMINMTRRPGVIAPVIDWSRETVILHAMGMKTSGGYYSTITYTSKSGNKNFYLIEEFIPQGMVTSVLTTPLLMVKVPYPKDEVGFNFR